MGWWGITEALFPEIQLANLMVKNLIDFDEIKEMLKQYYPSLEEDTRLYSDTECQRQVPFDRILPDMLKFKCTLSS